MDGEMRTCENCRCAAPFPATNPWDWCYEWVEGVPSWAGEGE